MKMIDIEEVKAGIIDDVRYRTTYGDMKQLIARMESAEARIERVAADRDDQRELSQTYRHLAESAEARAAQLQAERDDLATDYAMLRKERDAARYEAQMTAARIVADFAAKYEPIRFVKRTRAEAAKYDVLCELWHKVAECKS